MNANTKEEQTALTVPQRAVAALGEAANEAKLRKLVKASANILAVTNWDGREEAHRAGMVLLKTRTSIRATGKAARDDATKFSKAVIAKEDELVGLIEPEEIRLLGLRDGWDQKIADEKAAKIKAERERVELIAEYIAGIREDETDAIRICKTAAEVRDTLAYSEKREITEAIYQEHFAEAMEIHAAVLASIRAILAERETQEAAALAAEEARKAEAERIAAEKAELARQQAAAAIVAAEQAAEAKRLADAAKAQEAAAEKLRAQTAINLQAERDANAEQIRLERERANAELKAAQDKFNAEQAEFRIQQAAAQDAQRLADDHGPALEMNALFDAELAERTRCGSMVNLAIADAHAPVPSLEQLADDAGDGEPVLQHTPGPWSTNDQEQIVGSDGEIVVYELNCNSSDIDLIAAAPDLLAVVMELEESVGYWSEYDVPLGIVDRLRTAIDKATGRAA